MRFVPTLASLLAAAALAQPASADVMMVPVGGYSPKPVPMHPTDPDDSPEDIAKDAARDLKDSRFYNKPGATRAEYDRDWQECRLIARGSRTPAGTVPLYYNPAVVSPLAAGVGGALGGMIGAAIAEGEQRRQNRKNCLLIRGWKLVETSSEVRQRLSSMSDQERQAYLDRIVGAQNVEGEITELKSFSIAPELLGNVDGPLSGESKVFFGKKVDPAASFQLASNEAAVVLAFRRPEKPSAGRAARVALTRYDRGAGDLVYQPRDWKKVGDKTTYHKEIVSGDRKAGLEVQVIRLTPGEYVVSAVATGLPIMSTNCFGAPAFRLAAGEVAYVGDFVPVWGAKGSDGKKVYGMGHASRIEDSRRLLATAQPQLAAALKPAKVENGATYACSAVTMTRWDVAGADTIDARAAGSGSGN